jgi:lipoprotein-anchoring transpeptidase ErfK/SrfK
MFKLRKRVINVVCLVVLLSACNGESPIKKLRKLNYKKIFERVKKDSTPLISDTTNIFDGDEFDPTKDSLSKILNILEKDLMEDSAQAVKIGIVDSSILLKPLSADTTVGTGLAETPKDTFTNDIKKITGAEVKSLKYNLDQIKNRKAHVLADSNKNKTRAEVRVWANISKKKQLMLLHIDGELVDSFKVSTGDKKHETPTFDMRPNGPIFNKYTSKKFPGGNYNGLGNMPYVVFIKGGYAIHGTTKGNIPKLGKKASHGCVRLHPDNAKIFNEIVRAVGIENTWVTIAE